MQESLNNMLFITFEMDYIKVKHLYSHSNPSNLNMLHGLVVKDLLMTTYQYTKNSKMQKVIAWGAYAILEYLLEIIKIFDKVLANIYSFGIYHRYKINLRR